MELPIKQLKIVRYEKDFPDLNKKEFYALKESIEKWGIIEPIVINKYSTWKVIKNTRPQKIT